MNTGSLRQYQGGVAIITGGASGIGAALGRALAEQGCHVVMADLQYKLAEQEAAAIRAKGASASASMLDVRDAKAFKDLIDATYHEHGRIDYLFNNAGVITAGWDIKDTPLDDWNYIIDVNVRGVVHGTHAVYPIMIEQGFGHIVNTSSAAGLIPASADVGYTLSKHAIVGMSTALRAQAAQHGIRVSVLCPGLVDTPILQGGVHGRVDKSLLDAAQPLIEKEQLVTADAFVSHVLPKIEKNRSVIVEPRQARLVWLLYRLFPRFFISLTINGFKKLKKELQAPS